MLKGVMKVRVVVRVLNNDKYMVIGVNNLKNNVVNYINL